MSFEENEVSIKANGGTELAKRTLAARLPKQLLDNFQIICSRVRDLDQSKIRIYWCHDLPEDPECAKLADPNFRNKFHKIVYVSNHQYNRFRQHLNLPYSENDIVIENGIDPIHPDPNRSNDKIELVYTSTPHRGLALLIPAFELISQHIEDVHLHVFSSFEIYGWKEMDTKFQELFDRCKTNPKITYHGYQPYEKVREQLSKSHIFAYPSIWEETSCRALIEAMSAKLVCIHPNYGALADTAGGMTNMYQGDQDLQKHAAIFANMLHQVITLLRSDKFSKIDDFLSLAKIYTDNRFNNNKITTQWEFLLNDLLNKYPTTDERKIAVEYLTFKTE